METRQSKRKEAVGARSQSGRAKRQCQTSRSESGSWASGAKTGARSYRPRPSSTKAAAGSPCPAPDQKTIGNKQPNHQAAALPPGLQKSNSRIKEKGKSAAASMDKHGRPSYQRSKNDNPGHDSGSDEENDVNGEYRRHLSSASTALQGLLKKLGAGFDDIMPAGFGLSGGRVKNILSTLKSEDPSQQLDALSQLCELLSISNEEALTTFPVDEFVPILVRLLNAEHSPDTMLFAARALTFLADVLPSSCNAIVAYDAVPAFCARLLNIEYIDLAEQSLQALGKISSEHPSACIKAGGMCAVLSFLDFFPTSMQHIAVMTAATMASGAGSSSMEQVKDTVPILTNLLQHHDAKVVDNACLALSRLADAISRRPENLEAFCSKSLIDHVIQLVSYNSDDNTANLSIATYYRLLKLLSTCASGLPMVAETLLESGISSTCRDLLSTSTMLSPTASVCTAKLRSVDQLSQVLELIVALLPSVADPSSISITEHPDGDMSSSPRKADRSDSDTIRMVHLEGNPALMRTLGSDLLDQLLKVYGSVVVPAVRQQCLRAITKILHYSSAEALKAVLAHLPISSFLAGLLTTQEASIIASALYMAEILLSKMPDVLLPYFLKEGVVHAVEELAEQYNKSMESKLKGTAPTRMKTRSLAAKSSETDDLPSPDSPPKAQAKDPLSKTDLKIAVCSWAARFRRDHFVSAGITSKNLDTRGIQLMREASSQLKHKKPGSVSRILQILESSNDVSTFEFLSSGAVEAIHQYLSDLIGTQDGQAISGEDLQLLASFVFEALPTGTGSVPPLLALVNKLQQSLASTEVFPVMISNVRTSSNPYGHHSTSGSHRSAHQSRASSSSLSSGLSALSQPFKLRLCREASDLSIRDYSSNVVLIEPLATMRAIEEFLWPRIQIAETNEGSSRDQNRLRRSGLSASASGSGPETRPRKAASHPVPIDKKSESAERLTRSAAARAIDAAAAKAASPRAGVARTRTQGNAVGDAAFSPDEEEHEFGDEDEDEIPDDGFMLGDEDDDYDEDEEDDLNALGLSMDGMHVHDVSRAAGAPPPGAAGSSAGSGRPATGDAGANAEKPKRSNRSNQEPAGDRSGTSQSKLNFKMNGEVIQPRTTIFQAILQTRPSPNAEDDQENTDDHPSCSQRLWEKIHTVTYSVEASASGNRKDQPESELQGTSAAASFTPNCTLNTALSLDKLVLTKSFESVKASKATVTILELLRFLEILNRLRNRILALDNSGKAQTTALPGFVAREAFISQKLSPKLAQQLTDVLSICGGGLPSWCHALVKHAPFLFPFEIRRRYFYCTALGLARALQHLQNAQTLEGNSSSTGHVGSDGRETRLARLQRQKVRVNRPRILESAVKVMELYASHRAVLEVEYVGEVGTGLGPTLEFYTLLSHELQRQGLGMWREISPAAPSKDDPAADKAPTTSNGDLMIVAPNGLFPVTILDPSTEAAVSVLEKFCLLGRAMAKALQDSRLLDLPLSHCFYKVALGHPVDLYDIRSFDPQLGASMITLDRASRNCGADGEVLIDGMPLEELCLQFVVPGQENCELKPGGRDVAVTSANVKEYLSAVIDALLGRGIAAQIESFRSGFNEVFPLHHLSCFFEDELEIMLCGSDDPWDVDMLLKSIKFDHGYTSESAPVRQFVEALCDLDVKDRRAFLRFVTGSPRLPPGGLTSLQPQLTVVRKHPTGGDGFTPGTTPGTPSLRLEGTTLADNDLISVMTCANYIKLPPYSCKNVLVDRLMFVIREGQCSFDLS